METPFIGGAYLGRSQNLNAQVCQNLYPIVDQHGGKSVLGLYGVPGITSWINLGGVRSSGSLRFNGGLVYKNVWNPPKDALWAWFKHNEGAGTTIIDYSPVATNGQLFAISGDPAIEPNVSYFWNTNAGFGTETAAESGCRSRRQAPSRDSSYCSMVAFIKPLGYGMFDSVQAVQLGHTSNLNCLIVGWEGASSPHYWKFGYSAGQKTAFLAAIYGTWYCIYAYSQKGVNNNGLYIKAPGVAWAQALVNQGVATSSNGDQTTVLMFGGTTNPHAMVGGDALYYASATPDGIITLAQADDIYENLKGRY